MGRFDLEGKPPISDPFLGLSLFHANGGLAVRPSDGDGGCRAESLSAAEYGVGAIVAVWRRLGNPLFFHIGRFYRHAVISIHGK